jgi:ATP-dependent Clp protease protease subunit
MVRWLEPHLGAATVDGTRQHASERIPSPAMSTTPQINANSGGMPFGPSEIYNRLLNDRIVFLGTEVDDDIANILCAQMLFLEGQDREKDIWLYINSPGGSVTAGMAIYDTMQFVSCNVATVCMGLGASMGQFLLTAGAAEKRYILPHARVMMHQPLGGVRGQASDIKIQAEQMAYIKRLLAERIAFHSGQDVEQVQSDSERDRWFTAEEAKAYGLCDHVITKRGDVI